jgi:O-antigen/teichoic acid export membrane protein
MLSRVFRNSIWNLVRAAGMAIVGIATSVLLARFLTSGQLGIYSYIVWLTGFLTAMSLPGLPTAVTKYVSESMGARDYAAAREIVRTILKAGFLLSIGVTLVAAWVIHERISPDVRPYIFFALPIIPLSSLLLIILSAIMGAQRYRAAASISLLGALGQLILFVISFSLGFGIVGLLIATIGVNLLLLWPTHSVMNNILGNAQHGASSRVEWRGRLLRFCLQAAVILIIYEITWNQSEVFFLKRYSSVEQVAFYSMAFVLSQKAMQVPVVLSGALMPAISELYGAGRGHKIGPVYTTATRYLALLAFPLGLIGAAVAPVLIPALYGAEYTGAVPVFQIMFLSGTWIALAPAGSALLYGTDTQSFIVKWGSLIAVLNIVLDFWLIPRHGAVGAAIVNVSGQLLAVFVTFIHIARDRKIEVPMRFLLRCFGASLLAGLVSWLAVQFVPGIGGLMLAVTGGGVIYFALLLKGQALKHRLREPSFL